MSNSLQPHGENTGVCCLSLLQGIFPTQGLNPCLPHCRRILYQLSHKGSPVIICYSDLLTNYISFYQSVTFGHLIYSYFAIKNTVTKFYKHLFFFFKSMIIYFGYISKTRVNALKVKYSFFILVSYNNIL